MNSLHTIFLIFMAMINSAPENSICQGEPAIISANISYNDQYITDYLDMEKAMIQKQLEDTVITKEEYNKQSELITNISKGDFEYYLKNNNQNQSELLQLKLYSDSLNKWISIPWKINFLGVSPITDPIIIKKGISITFEYGIDPEEIVKIPPGDYKLRFETQVEKEGEKYSIISEDAHLKILKEKINPEDINVLYSLISYYTKRKSFDQAKNYNDQFLSKNPNSISGLTLMGNIYTGMKDYIKALEYYFRAETEFDRTGAPEEDKLYIIDQIIYVQSLMNQ